MASKKATASKINSPAASERSPIRAAPPARKNPEQGARDEDYALVSVLYHALQGADTLGAYIRDARNADDEELVTFFEETKALYTERAREAKELLASHLDLETEEEDSDEPSEEDEEPEDEEE